MATATLSKSARLQRSRAPAQRTVGLKGAREAPSAEDGMRVLVDRLWPRGMSKDQVAADLWLRDAAPTAALRRWYGHDAQRWDVFCARYRVELRQHQDLLSLLFELSRNGRVTLLFDAHDPSRNNAVVLRDVLHEMHAA